MFNIQITKNIMGSYFGQTTQEPTIYRFWKDRDNNDTLYFIADVLGNERYKAILFRTCDSLQYTLTPKIIEIDYGTVWQQTSDIKHNHKVDIIAGLVRYINKNDTKGEIDITELIEYLAPKDYSKKVTIYDKQYTLFEKILKRKLNTDERYLVKNAFQNGIEEGILREKKEIRNLLQEHFSRGID